MTKKIFIGCFSLFLCISVFVFANYRSANATSTAIIRNQVLDVGTYTEYKHSLANEDFERFYNHLPAACSACAKVTSDGKMIVGRNLDLTLTNKSVFVLRTAYEGLNKTLGLCYSVDFDAYYNDILNNGMKQSLEDELPFLCEDVMNEHGLYAEINMCYDEVTDEGTHFACPGTGFGNGERACCCALPQLFGTHCATISDVLNYAQNELDIYSLNTGYYNWCLNVMLADATGRYGVLQIAENKLTWLEGKQVLTNFFPDQATANKQKYKMGIGRYNYINSKIDSVTNESELMQVMKDVSYGWTYDKDNPPPYEVLSELAYTYDKWTYDYIVNNPQEIQKYLNSCINYKNSMTLQQIKNSELFWISIYNVVANCNNRTLTVRFFEDDSQTNTFTL